MNTIELQLWKNAERQAETDLARDIENRKKELAARQQFVATLSTLLDEFFADLVTGPVESKIGYFAAFYVPIRFDGKDGLIETTSGSCLAISIGTGSAFLGGAGNIDNMADLADWLQRNTA